MVEVLIATERYDPTYDVGALHPNGHLLSLDGQGHLPVRCDCPDPLDAARATRAQLNYVLWDAALGLLALAVGLIVVALAVAS